MLYLSKKRLEWSGEKLAGSLNLCVAIKIPTHRIAESPLVYVCRQTRILIKYSLCVIVNLVEFSYDDE